MRRHLSRRRHTSIVAPTPVSSHLSRTAAGCHFPLVVVVVVVTIMTAIVIVVVVFVPSLSSSSSSLPVAIVVVVVVSRCATAHRVVTVAIVVAVAIVIVVDVVFAHRAVVIIVGTPKDGYLRKVPLPRVPLRQSTEHVTASAVTRVPHRTCYLQVPRVPTWGDLINSLFGDLGSRMCERLC